MAKYDSFFNDDWSNESKKYKGEREKRKKSNERIRDRYKIETKDGANNIINRPSNERADYDKNFVWDSSYIKTAKKNASNITNTGISFYDRYSAYADERRDFSTQAKDFFDDGYNTDGDYLRKRITDLNQEAKEMQRQLESGKDDFVNQYGEKAYNDILKELKNDINYYKQGGKQTLAKRNVVDIFKNDEQYKDENARKTAYNEFLNVNNYYGYDLNYDQVQQEIANLKSNKTQAVKDPYYSQKLKYLENYATMVGYKDNDSYEKALGNLDSRIKQVQADREQKKSNLNKNGRWVYQTQVGTDENGNPIYEERDFEEDYGFKYNPNDVNQKSQYSHLNLYRVDKDGKSEFDINEEASNEINGLKNSISSIQAKYNTFKNYGEIIGKYADVENDAEYKNASTEVPKELADYKDEFDKLNDREKKIYNTLLEKGQKDRAGQFYREIINSFDYKARENERFRKEMKDASWWEQVGHSILSVPASVVGGISGAVSDIGNLVTGNELNPYDDAHMLSNYVQNVRSGVSESIEENGGEIASWAYNTTMGLADFATELLATQGIGKAVGLGSKGTSALMKGVVSTSAYNSTAMQAKQQGLDDATAVTLGIASGLIEWATEKYSIEALMGIKAGDKVYKSILKNALTEASEESASTVANYFVNMALSGQNSEHQQTIDNYIAHGYTEEEAKKQAYLDLGKQVVSDGLAGAVMGGVMGGTTAIASNNANKNVLSGQYAREFGDIALITDNAMTIIDNAKQHGIDTTKAEQLLAEFERLDSELEADDTNGELHTQYQEQFRATSDALAELELYIEQDGGKTEFKNVDALSQMLGKEADGTTEGAIVDEDFVNDVAQTVDNDIRQRGLDAQDVIVNKFKAKEIADEVSKLNDGNIKVVGDIRTDKVARKVQAFLNDRGYEVAWYKNSKIKDANGKFVKANVNGFTNGKKVFLNSDTPIERQIFKHEYNHILENAKGFDEYAQRVLKSKVFRGWIESKADALGVTDGTYNRKYTAVVNDYVRKQKKVKTLSNTQGRNEALADFMAEKLFGGKDFDKAMTELADAFEDKTAFRKFVDAIKDILSSIKEALGGSASIDALERNIVKLQNQIDNGEFSEKGKGENPKYSYSSITNALVGENDISVADFLKKDYKQSEGYKRVFDKMVNNIKSTNSTTTTKAIETYVEDTIDGIVRVAVAMKKAGYDIYDDNEKSKIVDSKKRLLFSSLEPNSEYVTSHDISTICDKSKNFTEIYDAIVKLESSKGVKKGERFFDNIDNYFWLHDKLAEKGLTTTCRQCYVGSMRKNLMPMAKNFLKLIQETDENNKSNDVLYNPNGTIKSSNAKTRNDVRKLFIDNGNADGINDLTVDDFTTADGLANLRITNPLLYETFNSFYGQSKPKMPKKAQPYRFGELTALVINEKGQVRESLIKKINHTGGFRLQSYSDFQIENFVDILQILFEAGTLGFKGHAYTKVPAFLDATKNTNLKRNISVFTYNPNRSGGEWKIDIGDSYPATMDELREIVKSDETGNTGVIVVSQNKRNSAWVMANDFINYFIPFHKSGLRMGDVRALNVKESNSKTVKGYAYALDHTSQQNEVWSKTFTTTGIDRKTGEEKLITHKINNKVKHNVDIYEFWDFANKDGLSKKELAEKNIKRYIDECEKQNHLPKFRDYVLRNKAFLEEVLRESKKQGTVGEDATVDDISFTYTTKERTYKVPYGYEGCLADFSLYDYNGNAVDQKVLSLENYDFDEAVKFFKDGEKLRRDEILQQFALDADREKLRASDLTTEELEKTLYEKRIETAKEALTIRQGIDFSIDDDAHYGVETQYDVDEEYLSAVEKGDLKTAKRLVDNRAELEKFTIKAYHGTPNGDFNTFKDWQYFTQNKEYADVYQNQGASSNGYKATANNPKTYEVYIKPKKIFDTRNSAERKIFENEFFGKWGNGTPLSSKGLPDWTDAGDLIDFFEENGYDYDTILLDEGATGGYGDKVNDRGISYVVKKSNQIKSADPVTYDDDGNVIPLSKRFNDDIGDIRFSADDDLAKLNKKYGTIKKGVNAERDIDVPKKTSDDLVTSYTVRSILEKGNIDGDALEQIKTDVINEARSHRIHTDDRALAYANKHLKNGDAEAIWEQAVKGKATKNDIAVGSALLEMYANSTKLDDTTKAQKILELTAELCEVGTRLGQSVQAFSLLKRMGGVGKLYYIQRSVDAINKDLEKKHRGKKQIEISEEEAEHLANAQTESEVTEASQELMKSLGEQLPPTFIDKWNAWRYLSMLGNARTHIRNIVGNTVFSPVVELKNGLSTVLEKAVIRDASKRTKAIKVTKDAWDFADKDFDKVADYITNEQKYNEQSEIGRNKQVFKLKPIEAFRKANFFLLEKEDEVFLKYHYKRALSQVLTARKIDVDKITDAQLQSAREYAILEAQKATFRDASEVANVINRFSRSHPLMSVFVEGILPFKKTPINIFKRGIEYSPIGVVRTLTKGANDLRKGKITASEFVDGLASGMTGTGLMMLGMYLGSLGIAIGGFDDDDEWFRKLNGEQEYSLQFGDYSYTIDWMAPACIPFFIGVEFQKALEQDYGNDWTKLANAIGNTAFEPIINMSMLQGINNTLETIKWGDNAVPDLLLNSIQSYFLQALPTIAGQLTRVAIPERKMNYVDKNSPIPEFMQKTLNKISAKTGDWGRPDYTDAWGNKETTGNIFVRIVSNMLSPGYTSKVDYDSVNTEFSRLWQVTGDKTILPDTVEKNIRVNGVDKHLTAEEYTKYQENAGKNAYKYFDELFKSETYQTADNETKIKMIKDVFSYAKNVAKTTVSNYQLEDADKKMQLYLNSGVQLDEYFSEKYTTDASETNGETVGLDVDRAETIINDIENTDAYDGASSSEKMSMVDAVAKYVRGCQSGNATESEKVIEVAENKGNDISGLIIAKASTSGISTKAEKLEAIQDSGVDKESEYIMMAYEYLSGRKVWYNDVYQPFSDLSPEQKYRYISVNESYIKQGLYDDYGV